MRKFLLLLICIVLLCFTGCTKKNDDINNDTSKMDELIKEEYGLSDKYLLDRKYVVKDAYIDYEAADSYEFESDGINYKIEWKKNMDGSYKVTANDVIMEIKPLQNNRFEDMEYVGKEKEQIGVIDMDPSDDYKEVIINRFWGEDASEIHYYRATKNGLEFINAFTWIPNSEDNVFGKINGKYILFVKHNYDITVEGPVVGYYTYEDGNFKYIEKFLTGEEIKDEQGNYNSNFRNQIYTAGSGDKGKIETLEGNVLKEGSKIKLIRQNDNVELIGSDNAVAYDIEIAENTKMITPEGEEIDLPYGTILKNVR